MASTQSSPVLIQHVSPHTLDTIASDLTLVPLSNMSAEIQIPEPAAAVPLTPQPIPQPPALTEAASAGAAQPDTPMVDAPTTEVETRQEIEQVPSDQAVVEQPTTEPTALVTPDTSAPAEAPVTSAEETVPVPADEAAPVTGAEVAADVAVTSAEETISVPAEEAVPAHVDPVPAEETIQTDPEPPPPPPPKPEHPEWVTWEDDNTTPTEEELKEVEDAEENALDVPSIEKKVYEEIDDPDQRPSKKIRLSWVIKGVRGTKERPNMSRTMHSPCALIDGHYWQIKFFPRGNKSASLSAYIRCTKHLPTPDSEVPESTFSYFEGAPDAVLGVDAQPKKVLHVPATPVKEKGNTSQSQSGEPGASRDSGDDSQGESSNPTGTETPNPTPAEPPSPPTAEPQVLVPAGESEPSLLADPPITAPPEPQPTLVVHPPDSTPTESPDPAAIEVSQTPPTETPIPASTEPTDIITQPTEQIQIPEAETPVIEEVKADKVEPPPEEDYRVSAQLGMVIYNPEEPRTCSANSSEHQFTKHNDDWGWTNFVGPWQDIHIRQRGQRQALLKNDTIAIDAYIRIFDDPSQALWWHVSHDHESIWPSKKLAGYFPMGTPPLYHSPAVAGITAWLLLAPVRKVLQEVDAGKWRSNSQVKPRPLIARLQNVLHSMRHLRKEEYVNVNAVIDCVKEAGESFNDVKSFWEAFRRSIELELEGETDALKQISEVFDTPSGFVSFPSLPVKDNTDIQTAIKEVPLPQDCESSAPNFLPLMLEREIFDKQTCEWKLCHDRVTLNDQISLSNGEEYTLYGFMVHVGVRNSGKFYSILRPNGLGTKWLAFEDGDGNKVFSYTRKHIQDYEGLIGDDLKNFKSTRQTAYMAMYIKNSCVLTYLPGKLEEFSVPLWLTISLGDPAENYEEQLRKQLEAVDKDGVAVEVYSDEGVLGRKGLLDMFNIKQQSLAKDHFWTFKLPKDLTFINLRRDLATQMEIDDVEKLRLFIMTYGEVGQYTSAQWEPVFLHSNIGYSAFFRRPLCLWVSLLKTEDDVKNFGVPDPVEEKVKLVPDTAETLTLEDLMSQNQTDPVDSTMTTDMPTADTGATREPDFSTVPALPAVPTQAPAEMTTSVESTETTTPAVQEPREATVASDTTMQDVEVPIVEIAFIEPVPSADAPEAYATESGSLIAGRSIDGSTEMDVEVPTAIAAAPSSPEAIMEDTPEVRAREPVPAAEVSEDPTVTEPPALTSETSDGQETRSTTQNRPQVIDVELTPLFAGEEDPPTELGEPAALEHGHLFDAVMSEHGVIPPIDAATVIDQTIASVRETPARIESPEIVEEPEVKSPSRPVPNVYGFLQTFDPDTQDFYVHSTFFAKKDELVKEKIRRCMGYDAEKAFNAWHRENTLDGRTVDDKVTFEDIQFSDGVDIVVGDILSESKKQDLRHQGKFSNPFALSRYLRMAERRHPVQARTSTEPVEISDFGHNYYKGALVKGQMHGEDCLIITSHGHKYEGPLIMNDKDGPLGKMTYQNGDVYDGGWKNDERDGQGTLTEKRTGNKYIGGFQNGKRWGKGVTEWQVADEEAQMCQICYGEEIDALFFDCGHVCSCVECAKQCDVCPICRRSVKQVVRMFKA